MQIYIYENAGTLGSQTWRYISFSRRPESSPNADPGFLQTSAEPMPDASSMTPGANTTLLLIQSTEHNPRWIMNTRLYTSELHLWIRC